jgi:hypothetical protein
MGRPTSKPVLTLLDANIYSQLYGGQSKLAGSELTRLKVRLQRARDEGELHVFGTNLLLEEICATVESKKQPETVGPKLEGFWFLTQRRMLRFPVPVREIKEDPGLVADQARLRRRLTPDEMFLSPDNVKFVEDGTTRNQGNVQQAAAAKTREVKKEFKDGERARREQFYQQIPKDVSEENMAKLWPSGDPKKRRAFVDQWTRECIERDRRSWGIKCPRSRWPKPRQVRWLWFNLAYHSARLAEVVGKGASIKQSDIYDHYHYADASCGDVLVTSDVDLLRRARCIDADGLQIFSFEEWTDHWLTR